MMSRHTINIIGLGYIGTAMSLFLASRGKAVTGWDVDQARVQSLQAGHLPYAESDLSGVLKNLDSSLLHFVNELDDLPRAAAWFICVGTPVGKASAVNLAPLLGSLRSVLDANIRKDEREPLVVLRSTVPPQTFNTLIRPLLAEYAAKHPGFAPRVAYYPEFLREGNAIEDLTRPPLNVVGVDHAPIAAALQELCDFAPGIEVTTPEAAEILKIACNSFHALKVTFANEVASVCQRSGVDSLKVMELMCRDQKLNISACYMRPGSAFGGPCLEKDLTAFTASARDLEINVPLLDAISASNQSHHERILLQVVSRLKGRRVGIAGLSFKDGSADLRHSPVVRLAHDLLKRRPDVLLHHYQDTPLSGTLPLNIQSQPDLSTLLENSDLLILGTYKPTASDLERLRHTPVPILDLMFYPQNNSVLTSSVSYFRVC